MKPWPESATPADAQALAQQAADWLVALSADDARERARAQAAFGRWKQADARHAAAAAPLEALLDGMAALRQDGSHTHHAQAVKTALQAATQATRRAGAQAPPARRRTMLATGATLAAVCVAASLAWRSEWAAPWHADLRTGPGEWAQHALPDGTRVALGNDSAVDWHDDAGRRALRLLRGEVLVDVAPDAARPLVVRTQQAHIRALGTRLLVQHDTQATQLTLLESSATVRAADASPVHDTLVRTGERVRVAAGTVRPLPGVDAARVEADWRRRELVVIDRPLPEVLHTLARHRPGRLGFDEDRLAHLRVTAVLPLDQPERALELLAQSFPALRVSRFTAYWVSVGLQPPPTAPAPHTRRG